MKKRNKIPFENFGSDVKNARGILNISRKELAEKVGIDPRYLANIENSGALPSLPIFYELIHLCRLPVDKYFFSESETPVNPEYRRVELKLSMCSQKYLSIVEATIDGAINLSDEDEE